MAFDNHFSVFKYESSNRCYFEEIMPKARGSIIILKHVLQKVYINELAVRII